MINNKFRELTGDLCDCLQHMKHMSILSDTEYIAYNGTENLTNYYKKRLDENEGFFEYLDQHFEEMMKLLDDINFSESSYKKNNVFLEHRKYYQSKVIDYFHGFALFNQIYYKPFGYAGDYSLINFYYDQCSWFGNSFDYLLDQYTINHSLGGLAIQQRVPYILKKIKNIKGDVRILSVGSGPAREIIELVKNNSFENKISFSLVDTDIHAIHYVKKQLKKCSSNIDVEYFNVDLLNLIKNATSLGSFDLIYSLGLFDYFRDGVFVKLAKKMFSLLNSRGELIIGNFDHHVQRSYMALLPEWYLMYRSESDLADLAEKCQFADYTVENNGIEVQLQLTVKK